MNFFLNESLKQYHGDPELSLLRYLREVEGITSAKDGCSPQAACGACAVSLDGKAVLSCVTPMRKVADAKVETLEGIGDYRREVFANAFVEKGAVQCGFCIPGIVMQANALIDKNTNPTIAEVQQVLTPHLCRCTGYKKIEDAILYAAEAIRQDKPIPKPGSSARLGERHPKYEARALTLGERPFVADLHIDGQLFGALRFSDHPRAKVLHIDLTEAKKVRGVVQILAAGHIPGQRNTGLIVPDWPLLIAPGEETRYIGDVLATVIAESEDTAREACKLIKVRYEVLTPVTSPREAAAPDAPKIHRKGNLLSETVISRGQVDKAKRESAFQTKGTYKTQVIEHGFMEPESCIAVPTGSGVKVYSQGQGIYEDRQQIARLLNLPLEQVEVVLVPNGGGFGGKEDLSVQGHAALGAYLLQRPVKITLTRDESILMHPKRHPLDMEYEVGCDEHGKLTFLKANIVGDTGAYASVGMKVLERAAGHAAGAYHIPHVDVVSRAFYTNNIPCGAMRGFGVNQVTFAIESCIDELCEKGGFDRWKFRYDNALSDGGSTSTGQIIESASGVRATLLAVKDAFYNAKYAGIACGIKNTGIGNGMPDDGKVSIRIESPDKVVLHHGWTEMGQGVHTMAVQFLCHETGIDPAIVEVRVETTANAPAGMTTASRATSIIGNSIIKAAKQLKQDLACSTLSDLTGKEYEGEWTCDWTTKPGAETDKIVTHYSYSYATQVVTLNDDGSVEKVYAAHDAGKIINPTLFEGQIEGSIHMGLGYALTEDLVLENCVPASTRLRKCGILRAKETPEMVVIGVEVPDPAGPYGAKGVGEIGLVPTAGAVANALYQYDGKRRYSLPMKAKKSNGRA